jgi:HlyD family secretion protein
MKYIKLCFFAVILLCTLAGCSRNNQNQFQGYIEGRFTYVASQMSGTLESLVVQRGTKVQTGQKLANLESNPELAEYNQAKSELNKAQSNLADLEKGERPTELAAIKAQQRQVIAQINFAAKTVKRYQHLVKTHAIQQSKLDEAISNYNKLNAQLAEFTENLKTAELPQRIDQVNAAKAQVAAAQAALQQASWKFNQKQLFSPANGRVYDTFYRIGETVPADSPILSLLDPKNVYVIFFLPERQLSSIKVGQKINFTCDSCKQPISATVYFVSDKAEYTPPVIYSEKSRVKLTYRIEAKLSIADAQKLNPGQPITINLASRI